MSKPFWISAYLDFTPDDHDEGLALWEQLTGYRRSAARGDNGEYVTLNPESGDGSQPPAGPGRLRGPRPTARSSTRSASTSRRRPIKRSSTSGTA